MTPDDAKLLERCGLTEVQLRFAEGCNRDYFRAAAKCLDEADLIEEQIGALAPGAPVTNGQSDRLRRDARRLIGLVLGEGGGP